MHDVDFVEISVNQFGESVSDDAARKILGFSATLAFIGDEAKQQDARQWVEDTLPIVPVSGIIEEILHGVRFALFGPPGGRVLQLGNLD